MAVVYQFPQQPDVESDLRRAIDELRLIVFTLHGLPRRAEPHDLGIVRGVAKLLFYQVGGRSRSRRPFGWRWAQLDEIRELQVLDDRFAGPRDSGTGDHVDWDRLIASVSRKPA